MSIHRHDCSQLLRLGQEDSRRIIDVQWSDGTDKAYPVDIRIEAYDRHGLIRDVTMLLSNSKTNVIGMNTHTDVRTNIATLKLSIEINSMDGLLRLFARISQLSNVISVEREAASG